VWAAATLGHCAPALFKEIEKRASFLVKEGKPQEIANPTPASPGFVQGDRDARIVPREGLQNAGGHLAHGVGVRKAPIRRAHSPRCG